MIGHYGRVLRSLLFIGFLLSTRLSLRFSERTIRGRYSLGLNWIPSVSHVELVYWNNPFSFQDFLTIQSPAVLAFTRMCFVARLKFVVFGRFNFPMLKEPRLRVMIFNISVTFVVKKTCRWLPSHFHVANVVGDSTFI